MYISKEAPQMCDIKSNNSAKRSNYEGLNLCFFAILDSHSITEIKINILLHLCKNTGSYSLN